MLHQGSSAAPASWWTYWISRRTARACAAGRLETTRPPRQNLARGLALYAKQGAAERGLAAAGFADQPEYLALANAQGNRVDRTKRRDGRAQPAPPPTEQYREVTGLQQSVLAHAGKPDAAASCCAGAASYRRQSTVRFGSAAMVRSCGCRRAQISRAASQRGAKRQPGGGASGEGTLPGMPANPCVRGRDGRRAGRACKDGPDRPAPAASARFPLSGRHRSR